jgi:murein DD-endopeptidase MepM/ murein hydrolase activator NlpD
MVHSFAFNDSFGDYGATIIIQHQLDTVVFHTLYGHVSLVDLAQLQAGKYISRGEPIAHFGEPSENGWWPPHLHFQVIADMELKEGDYPGVCTLAERERYIRNCPDPEPGIEHDEVCKALIAPGPQVVRQARILRADYIRYFLDILIKEQNVYLYKAKKNQYGNQCRPSFENH